MPRLILLAASAAALLTTGGCGPSRPARLVPPPLDPAAVTDAALGGAAALSGAELKKIPALAAALPLLDTDGDKSLSRAELLKWFEEVVASKVAITSIAVNVTHKGRPLKNAQVRGVPESFMTGAKTARGTTDQTGSVMVAIPGETYPGVNCGLFKVEITGTGNDGKPLAAKYNTGTTLGVAVGGMLPENGMAEFKLD